MVEDLADVGVGLGVGAQRVGLDAPQFAVAGQAHGAGGGVAAEQGRLADQGARPATRSRFLANQHFGAAVGDPVEVGDRLAFARQNVAGAGVDPQPLVDQRARLDAVHALQGAAAERLFVAFEARRPSRDQPARRLHPADQGDQGGQDRRVEAVRRGAVARADDARDRDHAEAAARGTPQHGDEQRREDREIDEGQAGHAQPSLLPLKMSISTSSWAVQSLRMKLCAMPSSPEGTGEIILTDKVAGEPAPLTLMRRAGGDGELGRPARDRLAEVEVDDRGLAARGVGQRDVGLARRGATIEAEVGGVGDAQGARARHVGLPHVAPRGGARWPAAHRLDARAARADLPRDRSHRRGGAARGRLRTC